MAYLLARIREGKLAEARAIHNAYVDAQLKAASQGPINLSDLICAKEAFIIHEIEQDYPTG